jgi:hypothetical protein
MRVEAAAVGTLHIASLLELAVRAGVAQAAALRQPLAQPERQILAVEAAAALVVVVMAAMAAPALSFFLCRPYFTQEPLLVHPL